jgi:hypothetical protein
MWTWSSAGGPQSSAPPDHHRAAPARDGPCRSRRCRATRRQTGSGRPVPRCRGPFSPRPPGDRPVSSPRRHRPRPAAAQAATPAAGSGEPFGGVFQDLVRGPSGRVSEDRGEELLPPRKTGWGPSPTQGRRPTRTADLEAEVPKLRRAVGGDVDVPIGRRQDRRHFDSTARPFNSRPTGHLTEDGRIRRHRDGHAVDAVICSNLAGLLERRPTDSRGHLSLLGLDLSLA